MLEAVFISDLHLHPEQHDITQRFFEVLEWSKSHTKALYILGDFFHAWPGDDSMNEWSTGIASACKSLHDAGVALFFMHGNRDFLLGDAFFKHAGVTPLPDPFVLNLSKDSLLLSHGDRYCTRDKAHQRFMRLTRNRLFKTLFLRLPLSYRQKLVNRIRDNSMKNKTKTKAQMDVTPEVCIDDMKKHHVTHMLHGHTHQPNTHYYSHEGVGYARFVLSDWDDTPWIMCYDETKRFRFVRSLKSERTR